MKRQSHLVSLDILRLLATLLIILFHALPLYHYESNFFVVGTANEKPAMIAVGIFFLLSGACLMVSDQKEFDVKAFYRKRFFRIMVPFYVVTIILQILRLFWGPLTIIGIKPFSFKPVDLLLFTTGQSEYLSNYGIGSWQPIVGEWFLSVLIICYAVFPLHRKAMLSRPNLLMILAIVVYVICFPLREALSVPVQPYASLTCKMFEFITGMYLMKQKKYLKTWPVLPLGIILAAVVLLLPFEFPFDQDIRTNLFVVPLFAAILSIPQNGKEIIPFSSVLSVFSRYSYEIYLLHHVVLYLVAYFTWMVTTKTAVMIELVAAISIMFIGAVILKRLDDWIEKIIRRKK